MMLPVKADLMRSINDGIALFAADEPAAWPQRQRRAWSRSALWTFVCECGDPDCSSWVELELAQFEAIREAAGGVLAAGHHPASASESARRQAGQLREGAAALRAAAKQQRSRAKRLNVNRD